MIIGVETAECAIRNQQRTIVVRARARDTHWNDPATRTKRCRSTTPKSIPAEYYRPDTEKLRRACKMPQIRTVFAPFSQMRDLRREPNGLCQVGHDWRRSTAPH